MVISVKSHLRASNTAYVAKRCEWEMWRVKIRVDVAVELTMMSWCFSSPSQPSSSSLSSPPPSPVSFTFPPSSFSRSSCDRRRWSLCSTRSTFVTFSQRAGPLGPNLPSINVARYALPDLAPRGAIPPYPLTNLVLPRLTSRRLRSPLLSLQQCCFADTQGIQRRCRHHPSSNSFPVREVVSEMKAKKEELKVKKQLLGLVGTVVALNYRLESVRE